MQTTANGRTKGVVVALLVDGAALILLSLLVRARSGNRFDRWWYDRQADTYDVLDPANAVLDAVSGRWAVGAAAGLGALALLRWRSVAVALYPIAAPALAWSLAEHVLKPVIDRPAVIGAIARAPWPSGTMAAISAASVACVVLLDRLGRWPAAVGALIAVATTGIVTISFVLTAYHWMTDLIGGVLVGMGVAGGLGLALRARERATDAG